MENNNVVHKNLTKPCASSLDLDMENSNHIFDNNQDLVEHISVQEHSTDLEEFTMEQFRLECPCPTVVQGKTFSQPNFNLEKSYIVNTIEKSMSDFTSICDKFEVDSPNVEERTWINWSPKTVEYWTLQYSDYNNNKLERPLEVSTKQKETSKSHMKLNIPQDADHFPTRMNNNSNSPGRDNNNNNTDGSENPSNNRYFYIPFVNNNSRPHQIGPGFQNSRFRSVFFSRVFLIKTIQMAAIMFITLGYRFMPPPFDVIKTKPNGSSYVALLIFLVVFCSVRCLAYGRTISGALLTLLLYTICSATICSTIYYNAEPQIVIVILLILGLTYGILSFISYFTKLDISEKGNIFCVSFGIVLLNTLISLGIIMIILNPFIGVGTTLSKGARFSGICAPALMTTITLILISEIHQIMGGFRLALSEGDYIIAAGFLI